MKRYMSGNSGSEEVIAIFGQGRLVQVSRIRLAFRGGSADDLVEAQSWMAMFMPEFVLADESRGLRRLEIKNAPHE